MTLKERMPKLLGRDREQLATLQANAADPKKDWNGCCSSVVQGTLRFIGVAEFVVSGNVQQFRHCLSDSARNRLRLFERHSSGEPIDSSYVAMLSYKELFDALAAGDFDAAGQLARLMGGRPELEAKYDHPFDYSMGYTLKAFVQRAPDEMEHWTSRFTETCQSRENVDFAGYAQIFRGILSNDERTSQDGLVAIARGHKNQSKPGGVFNGFEDETLCVWGVGIANLARHSGLVVMAVPPLIPEQLLLPELAGPY